MSRIPPPPPEPTLGNVWFSSPLEGGYYLDPVPIHVHWEVYEASVYANKLELFVSTNISEYDSSHRILDINMSSDTTDFSYEYEVGAELEIEDAEQGDTLYIIAVLSLSNVIQLGGTVGYIWDEEEEIELTEPVAENFGNHQMPLSGYIDLFSNVTYPTNNAVWSIDLINSPTKGTLELQESDIFQDEGTYEHLIAVRYTADTIDENQWVDGFSLRFYDGENDMYSNVITGTVSWSGGYEDNPTSTLIEKPSDIIYHILGEELGYDGTVNGAKLLEARNNHADWEMGFTVHKKINSKKLIEGIAKESRLLPYFKNTGQFSFNTIRNTYAPDDVTHTIKDSEVVSFSFDRTKIEDIKTGVTIHYKKDYATDEFKKQLPLIEAGENLNTGGDYSPNYYGITEGQGEDPIELDYIRDENTALCFQKFLLGWYANQHNTVKVKLPLRYLSVEIGDVVEFDSLLGGLKAYGEDYTISNNRNGQEIYPYWLVYASNKTLEYVEIEAIQLHDLTLVEAVTGGDSYDISDNLIGIDSMTHQKINATAQDGNQIQVSDLIEAIKDEQDIEIEPN